MILRGNVKKTRGTLGNVTPQVTTQDTSQVATQDTSQVTTQDTPQDTPQVKQLVQVVKKELSRSELMVKLGLKDRMHFVHKYLSPALKAGLIEMTIPDKPTSRLQKYRLTEAGKALLVSSDS